MAARQPRLSLMADLPTNVAIQIAGHLASTSERPMDDLRTLRATCRRMNLVCRNPKVGRRVNVAGLTDMAWHTPDAYHTFVSCMAQLVLDKNIEHAAVSGHEVAAYVAVVLLYMANGGAGVDATARQYMRHAAMVVDNTWPRPAGVRDDMFRECFKIRRMAAHVVWRRWRRRSIRVAPAPPLADLPCAGEDCGVALEWSWRQYCSKDCRMHGEMKWFLWLILD
ncbi:hypothetical protein C2845_PMPSC055978 [Panicum miliaceum]|uniref:F-box domain-containing protein n=1 Tax=Panicum miliaceum TaxID=4540 RepID=A0A3L6P980_PANMI|nr:hypothetical protein C2845_PMPSC055978 [Panicum miliaceum]